MISDFSVPMYVIIYYYFKEYKVQPFMASLDNSYGPFLYIVFKRQYHYHLKVSLLAKMW